MCICIYVYENSFIYYMFINMYGWKIDKKISTNIKIKQIHLYIYKYQSICRHVYEKPKCHGKIEPDIDYLFICLISSQ